MYLKKATTILASPKTLALADQAVASGGNFALAVLLARYLGMEAFGQYSLLWMGVLFMLSLHQAFMTQPFMSLVAGKDAGEQAAYFQSLSALQIILSVGISMLAFAIYFTMKVMGFGTIWLPWLPLAGLLAAAYLLHDFLRKYCFAKGLVHLPLLMDVAVLGLMFPSLILLYLSGKLDLGAALWAVLFAYCCSSGLGIWFAGLGLQKSWDFKHLQKTAKEHYHFSFWLLGTSLVQWFSGNYFLVAAAAMLGAVAVGALRMAQNMVGLCHVLFLAMENIVPVEAARQFFTNGEKAMYGYLRRVGLLAGIPVGLLLGLLTLASHWLIGWLYGAIYQPFGYLVTAYALVYALGFVGTILRFSLRSMQYTLPIFIGYTASAVASVLFAHPLVSHWGMGGVMAGLVGAQVITLLVYSFSILKKRNVNLAQTHPTTPSSPARPITPSSSHSLSPAHSLSK